MKKCIAAAFLLTALISCKSSKEDLLIKNKWRLSTATAMQPVDLNNKGTGSTDLASQSPSCINDDLFIFKDKGVFELDDSLIKCEDGAMQNGKWSLSGDSLALDFGTQDLKVKYLVKSISADELVLVSRMDFIPGGVDVTYVFEKAH